MQALRHNYAIAQSIAPQAQNLVMVKGNAYGHGAVEVATALAPVASAFGVASIEEAFELRQNNIKQPILLLEGTFTSEEVEIAAKMNFWLLVENKPQVRAILRATNLESKVNVWLGLDTGMHRLGFQTEEIQSAYDALSNSANVNDDIVIQSHFACADNLEDPATLEQIATFNQLLPVTEKERHITSLANSAGVMAWPQSHGDWNRPGYMLYGNSPFDHPHEHADQLESVMSLESGVISLRTVLKGDSVGYGSNWTAQRNSTIATISAGYGDGYPRQARNGTPVVINGVRCPLAGCVSMDMITVDVTDLKTVNIGDRVVLWGQELSLKEVAEACGTVGYELMTRVPVRVPRMYSDVVSLTHASVR